MARLRCSWASSESGTVRAIAATTIHEAIALPIVRVRIFTFPPGSYLAESQVIPCLSSRAVGSANKTQIRNLRPSGLSRAKKNQRAAREQQEHAENSWNFDNSCSFHDRFLRVDHNFLLL